MASETRIVADPPPTVTELILRWRDESPERLKWFDDHPWESSAALSAAHAVINHPDARAAAQNGRDVQAAQLVGLPPEWVTEGLRPFRLGGNVFFPLP